MQCPPADAAVLLRQSGINSCEPAASTTHLAPAVQTLRQRENPHRPRLRVLKPFYLLKPSSSVLLLMGAGGRLLSNAGVHAVSGYEEILRKSREKQAVTTKGLERQLQELESSVLCRATNAKFGLPQQKDCSELLANTRYVARLCCCTASVDAPAERDLTCMWNVVPL